MKFELIPTDDGQIIIKICSTGNVAQEHWAVVDTFKEAFETIEHWQAISDSQTGEVN